MHKSCWTEEETALLLELEMKFKNECFVNKLIGEHLPTKMAKQISNKRQQLAASVKTATPPRRAAIELDGEPLDEKVKNAKI